MCSPESCAPRADPQHSSAASVAPALMLLVLLTGCSRVPTQSLGKQTLEARANSESGGAIVVSTFTKTNGIQRQLAGQGIYVLEYLGGLKFAKAGWKGGDAFVGHFSDFSLVGKEPGGWDSFGKAWKYFDAGDEVEISGEITYELTEKGWRATDLTVKTYRVAASKQEQTFARVVGQWDGFTIYFDPQEQKNRRGAPQHCELVRDQKGVRFMGENGSVLAEDEVYLRYGGGGKLYGSYVAGKHSGTHGQVWTQRFFLELRDDNTLLFDDGKWKHEYRKKS